MTEATTESQRPLTSAFNAYFISILFAGINSCMFLFCFVFLVIAASSPIFLPIHESHQLCDKAAYAHSTQHRVDACIADSFLWLHWMSMCARQFWWVFMSTNDSDYTILHLISFHISLYLYFSSVFIVTNVRSAQCIATAFYNSRHNSNSKPEYFFSLSMVLVISWRWCVCPVWLSVANRLCPRNAIEIAECVRTTYLHTPSVMMNSFNRA